MYLQVHVSWAPTEDEALAIAFDQWRTNVFDPPLCWDLALVEHFDEAARHVRPEDVAARVIVSSDPSRHLARLVELVEIGFDGIWLHHVGTEQQRFIDVFGEHVVPRCGSSRRDPARRRVRRRRRGYGWRMPERWYRHGVIYCLDVDTFQDSNGDGIGDLPGLIGRLDYLARLGVTCLWLNPIHPSPDRDDGYDITDFYGVDPRLGTLGDFVELIHQAGNRGIRVIIDLVVNHTSDQHPWFQSARADPESPYRDWYVWSDDEPSDRRQGMVFPGYQETTWTFDERGRRLVLPPLLRLPARPQHGQPGGARRRSRRSSASGCSSASPGSAWTPPRSSSS